MKIHVRQIAADGSHLEGEEDCAIPDLETEEVHRAGPLEYSLDLGVSEGALWANGSLVQPVELRCVNCLETFVHQISVPSFALHLDLTGPELVDLTPFIREDLLLNLPAHPHCDRDGGRQCPGQEKTASVEPKIEVTREHDWDALDKLKLKS
jgi:uncharacterized metal-binding protein YceD (DUF177 family)